MKKFLAVLLTLAMALFVVACGPSNDSGSSSGSSASPQSDTSDGASPDSSASSGNSHGQVSWADGEIPIALITDYGTIDEESFNQGSWEGVLRYADANNIPRQYIQPVEVSTAAYIDSIELAISAGAQIVVTPGFLFMEAIYEAQSLWPDVKFVLLDAVPAPEDGDAHAAGNTVAVLYAEEQSGFLAGYAAVMDGHRNLGYIGGVAVPSVVKFGHGFVEGAEYAASELGLAPGDITVRFTYAGTFAQRPEEQTMAASWYADGVEIIFVAGGRVNLAIFAAADASPDGLVIGVDVDQGHHSPRIITSAMKDLRSSVANVLADFFAGRFPGGQIKTFDAAIDGIGLPDDFSRFSVFTKSMYDDVFAQLVSGAISVSDDVSNPNPVPILNPQLVSVTYIG